MPPRPKPARGKMAREAAAIARTIADREIGPLRKLKRQGGGLSNFVFAAAPAKGDVLILRLGEEPEKQAAFLKEGWAMEQAAKVGIPVAEVAAIGVEKGWAYMIQRRVAGEDGTHHPERRTVLKEMGRMTRRIHSIPTKGFGHSFDPAKKTFTGAKSWSDHCANELKLKERLSILNVNRMLSRHQSDRLEGILREIADWKAKPVLNHGDMRLKNVIVDGDPAKISAVIDWDLCASSVAPYWDLSLALHDLSIDAKQAFLEGYGCDESEIARIANVLKAFNIINYAPFVAHAADTRDEALLESYRTRFSGALDLYSL